MSSLNRGVLVFLFVTGFLAGCDAVGGSTTENKVKPLASAAEVARSSVYSTLRIVDVEVELAEDFTRTAPNNGVSDQDILNELRTRIPPTLTDANPSGSVPVLAKVEVLSFSFAKSEVTVRSRLYQVRTSSQIGEPMELSVKRPVGPSVWGTWNNFSGARSILRLSEYVGGQIASSYFSDP